jgi:hypothetical protein
LFGYYENFPKNFHDMSFFQYQDSIKGLQYAILRTLHRLNLESFDLGAVTPYLKQNCVVSFEFGVADGFNFNFLNQDELTRCLKTVDENELLTLDFFFAIRYHIVKDDHKRVPLKFDYHLLRLVFQEGGMEIQICHEKGTQRVPMDDLTIFLIERINVALSQKKLMPLFHGISEKSE